eukprot:Protomagalhaensia_sp_Gyna_25__3935@NODE_353_length_3762_cov_303_129734_g272_i0_p3_GENE_NODE_353_length_3762_cov_303_129734_g272_i0NODE_353_length_3762_cov_303_129734_g272_i0_p3_ORF_typecomplete_len199_score12_82_NODE_353_length_3762_cov_303_129734_g272_i065661
MESNSLLASIKQSLLEANDSAVARTPATAVSETDDSPLDRPQSTLTVKVSKVPKTSKEPKYEYPYRPLADRTVAYRGYPVDGAQSLKKSRNWRIQIVNCALGAPSQPLPQFPQQEVLTRKRGEYRGCAPMQLTEKQIQYNSGEAWIDQNDPSTKPRSEYFFTAGYVEGSAVRLQKPVTESIYRSVVAGSPVPVKVIRK